MEKKLQLITDQHVPIEIDFAPIGNRLFAVFIDMMVLLAYAILMILLLVKFIFNNFSFFDFESYDYIMFLYVFTLFLPLLLYTPLMEYFTKGQTVGKMILKIRVTKINGENAQFKDYFTRWLFRPYEAYFLLYDNYGILFFIISFFFDTLVCIISPYNQRIGDFMTGTVVVQKKAMIRFPASEVLEERNESDYQPKYQNITIYTDEDMMTVKNVIERVGKYPNEATKKTAIVLIERIVKDLKLEKMPENKHEFLKDVLTDYIALTR